MKTEHWNVQFYFVFSAILQHKFVRRWFYNSNFGDSVVDVKDAAFSKSTLDYKAATYGHLWENYRAFWSRDTSKSSKN